MIENLLADRSQDRSHLFVFPSQVAADFWKRRLLERGPLLAVENDRFCSWDAFKERYLTRQSELRPVNKTARRIYAASLLEAGGATLEQVVPASGGAVTFLARVLPELPRLTSAEASSHLPSPMRSAWRELAESYGEFLAARGLFEPSWIAPEAQHLPGGGSLFFPELLADFREHKALLESMDEIELIPASDLPDPKERKIREFGHVQNEMKAAIQEIGALLNEGVSPASIAVTLADLERHRRQINSLAAAYGVPLRERSGSAITELPGGRLFSLLDEWHRRAYHPDALASLLFDRSIPWAEPKAGVELISLGRQARCIGADRHAARRRWLRALAGNDGASSLFRRLSTLGGKIIEARGFSALRTALYEFIGALLDDRRWQPEALAIFQRGTLLASRLVAVESQLGLQLSSPWSQFLALLGEEHYVRQESREGVALYPYRVSAGIAPEYHILINLTHADTRVRKDPLSFLREDLRERFALAPVELSEPFLSAYTRSGRHVSISHSRVNATGAQITPAYFMGNSVEPAPGAGEPAGAAPADEPVGLNELEVYNDPYDAEREYYAGERELSGAVRLYPGQRRGGRWMVRQRLDRRRRDYTRERITDTPLLPRLYPPEEPLRLSPSGVDAYRSSPFAFLLQRRLKLEELDTDPHAESALLVGSYYHALLGDLNEELIRRNLVASTETKEEVRGILDECASRLGQTYLRRELALPEPALGTLVENAPARLWAALEMEIDALGPFSVTHREFPFDVAVDESYRITGRIDRLGVTEAGGYTVVDYKKSSAGAARETNPVTAGGARRVRTLQLPIYLLAAEAELDRSPAQTEEVYYLGLENREIRALRSEAGKSKDNLGPAELISFLEATREILAEVAEAIRAGDFRCADGAGECEDCPFRGVCRSRFAVRDHRG
ncbi:MAG: PD-(D/E)XK nuclease family protein [Alkalispirochaetaceae bacterium]